MKLSTKSKYAIIALLDMQETSHERIPISLVSISQRQGLPLAYLEQIFLKLRKAGIVESSRGFHGGYKLSRAPIEITLYDIVFAVDTLEPTEACAGIHLGCKPHGAKCLTHQLLYKLDDILLSFIKQITLDHISHHALIGGPDLGTADTLETERNRPTSGESKIAQTLHYEGCVYAQNK